MTRYNDVNNMQVAGGSLSRRSTSGVLSLLQLLFTACIHSGVSYATPIGVFHEHGNGKRDESDPDAWVYLTTAIFLVLLGGAFAGLTIALMGQDEVYLQVIATSGEGAERKNATKVLNLLKRGKHWVLVTLLVGNVITNETLPIVLDRSIGGGYAAAISSTLLVIVFGEIVPQSICVRFGLPIGAWMANFVFVLMCIFAPITWPTAKLLDRLLGEDHGTTYKKAGLKTLVTLHKTLGAAPGDRLNEDEVSIISGVLDLKEKTVGRIMTPMNDVFTLPADAVLDEDMMDEIMREGYSRIPIHEPNNKGDFVGMLLVKMLITYDPEDAHKVSDFSLATLPETRPETSCLDIINFFQQGKSHMVLVSDFPGKPYGALGVVTLEDVIEELIGEEIIDESDVFIDVHKAIRRMHPAPTHRTRMIAKRESFTSEGHQDGIREEDLLSAGGEGAHENTDRPISRHASLASDLGRSPRAVHFLMRRKSSQGRSKENVKSVTYNTKEMREQLRSLGPSNAAKQPRASRVGTVTIKTPGVAQIPENDTLNPGNGRAASPSQTRLNVTTPPPSAAQGGIGHDLVTAGLDARDGVQAVQAGHSSYGTWSDLPNKEGSPKEQRGRRRSSIAAEGDGEQRPLLDGASHNSEGRRNSESTIGSMHSGKDGREDRNKSRRGTARSGSITEQYVSHGGVRKMVLETTSSSEEGSGGDASEAAPQPGSITPTGGRPRPGEVVENSRSNSGGEGPASNGNAKKKRRRPRKAKTGGGSSDQSKDESGSLI